MSVLIRGMEMPQRCGQCKLFHAEQPMYCIVDKNYRTVGAPYGMPRPDWCPLVEIPTPHGRLINTDELMEEITAFVAFGSVDYLELKRVVKTMNAVIEAEGREE